MTEIGLAVMETDSATPPETVMEEIRKALEDVFAARVSRSKPLRVPGSALEPARAQYNAPVVLKALLELAPPGPEKVLGVADVDLYIPMLSFVYGQAQLGGRAGLVSLARLRQEFYGLPASGAVLETRARKEAVHETGHLFGLVHCESPECAMRLSTNIRHLDLKGDGLCAGCSAMAMEKAR